MTDECASSSTEEAEHGAQPVFAPYDAPAGGWGALHAVAKALREQSIVLKGSRSLLSMNQPDGFDCPGCAWPDPRHTSSFEFCENWAKAVAFELTSALSADMLAAVKAERDLKLKGFFPRVGWQWNADPSAAADSRSNF
jgi:hypothetical protein